MSESYGLAKTEQYLDTILSRDRRRHHIYVIEQKIMDLVRPLDELSRVEINEVDETICKYLKYLDMERD